MLLSPSRLSRFGILTLPLAGLLYGLGLALRGSLGTAQAQVDAAVTSTTNELAWVLLLVGSLMALYGVMALYRALAFLGKSAFWAMMCCLTGWTLQMIQQGFHVFLGPTLFAHPERGMQILSAFTGIPLLLNFVLATLLAGGGTLLLSLMVWRSHQVPRWVSLVYAPHALLLIAGGFSLIAQLLGAVALTSVGIAFTRMIWQRSERQPLSGTE